MKRTINTEIVKRLRNAKGWSQEELAIAADLSTRTVQRLESAGGGSSESIKSIASALEVDIHNLDETPRGNLIGILLGIGGVFIGAGSALIAIISSWNNIDGTAYEAGLGFGVVGLITGVSCAFIGRASARN